MSAPIVRAIDIGYGNVKLTVNDEGEARAFPSLAPRAQVQRSPGGLGRARRTSQVWVDGQVFEVGPDTVLFSDIPVLHADYTETAEYRALLYGALEMMQVEQIDLLVTGLPVHLHDTRAARLKQLLKGEHNLRPGLTVKVMQAAVVMQPLGGFVAHVHAVRGDWLRSQERTYLLIDPGFFSFDWMVTRGMQEVPGLSGSVAGAVAECLRCIEEALNRGLGEAYSNLRRLDAGLRSGQFRFKGQCIDLEPYREYAQPVVDSALRALRNRVGAGEEIDEIVLAGGGAPYFLAGVRASFPQHPLQMVHEPMLANVRGFQIIGKILLQGMK